MNCERDDKNGHLVSCLIENLDKIEEQKCKTFLTSIAAIMFTDYRLISNFQERCSDDILQLKCGRLDSDANAPTDQGRFFLIYSEYTLKNDF